MNEEIIRKIVDAIRDSDRIIITRHINPDGDALGSTVGLYEVIKASYPDKEIYLTATDKSECLAFVGEKLSTPDDIFRSSALAFVLDTANPERISDPDIVKCREIVKIDHHIDVKPFGSLSWVEDFRSSVCEMITELCMSFPDELKMTREAARCLYTGIVTDTGRFRFPSTTAETMRCAAYLLGFGIDTYTIFANLYLEDINELKFKSYVYEKTALTANSVAYILVDREMQDRFSLSIEQSGNCVTYLESIKGSLIYIAFIENPDGTIRVRLRSRLVAINSLAEKYGGGGHKFACGATVSDKHTMTRLLADADTILKEYKTSYVGCL